MSTFPEPWLYIGLSPGHQPAQPVQQRQGHAMGDAAELGLDQSDSSMAVSSTTRLLLSLRTPDQLMWLPSPWPSRQSWNPSVGL